MTYAEVNFLMAEAALKGWAVAGSADSYYKTGAIKVENSSSVILRQP